MIFFHLFLYFHFVSDFPLRKGDQGQKHDTSDDINVNVVLVVVVSADIVVVVIIRFYPLEFHVFFLSLYFRVSFFPCACGKG